MTEVISEFEAWGTTFRILVPRNVEKRLAVTHFRGREVHAAGNFFLWTNAWSVLRSRIVKDTFMPHIRIATKPINNRVEVLYPHYVGWSSTDTTDNYTEDDLEDYYPNKSSIAKRVKTNLLRIPAPLTRKLTISYDYNRHSRSRATI